MKKIALICLMSLFAGSALFAQNFRLGLTASPVISWFGVDGKELEADGPRVGFQYGLIVEPTIGSVERYAFSTGVMVNMVGGFLASTDSLLGDLNSTLRVQYIEVPLTAKLRTNEINYISYYGLFGLTPGINIKARYDLKDSNGDYLFEDENLRNSDLEDQYKLFNLSLTLGVGAEYSITETTSLTGGIAFQNGFTNVFESSQTNESIRLKQFVFRLGFLF